MRHIVGIAALGLGTLVLGTGVASAQEAEQSIEYKPSFDPEQFSASADPDQIGLMEGARTQTMGTLSAGVVFHFAGAPLDISVRNRGCTGDECMTVQGDIIKQRLRADLGLLYGFGRFDVRLTLPFVIN